MTRTRRRPLPAHQVEPERAVVFGLALGVISFVVMAWFVNLLAAFLTLLAIAFYVVVYTILLKRTTPQNIVIGGAAGALPPVIGWAAVTGNVGLPALLLFALVFYWTPPHFWALSLRIRKDYAAAGVPMLPVVKGIPETTRQIGLYTVLMVAISLVLFAVARMGADLPRRGGRPRRDLPVAGLRPVAARLVRGGVDGRRDPPLQVLDQLPDPALPRGRRRRAGAHPRLIRPRAPGILALGRLVRRRLGGSVGPGGDADARCRHDRRGSSWPAHRSLDDPAARGEGSREPRLGVLARHGHVDAHRMPQQLGRLELLHPDRRSVTERVDAVVVGHRRVAEHRTPEPDVQHVGLRRDRELHLLHGRAVGDRAVCPRDRRDRSREVGMPRFERPSPGFDSDLRRPAAIVSIGPEQDPRGRRSGSWPRPAATPH